MRPVDPSKLPYFENPADATQVVDELTKLIAIIGATWAGAGSNTDLAARLIQDPKQEPGRSIAIQKFRLACALDSLVSHQIEESIKILMTTLNETTALFRGATE